MKGSYLGGEFTQHEINKLKSLGANFETFK